MVGFSFAPLVNEYLSIVKPEDQALGQRNYKQLIECVITMEIQALYSNLASAKLDNS